MKHYAVLVILCMLAMVPACGAGTSLLSPQNSPASTNGTSKAERWKIYLLEVRDCPDTAEGWKIVRIEIAVENRTSEFDQAKISTKDAKLYTDSGNFYDAKAYRTTGSKSEPVDEISFISVIPHGFRMRGEYRNDAVTMYYFQSRIPKGSNPKNIQIPGRKENIPIGNNGNITFPISGDTDVIHLQNTPVEMTGKAMLTVGESERKPGLPFTNDWIGERITITNLITTADLEVKLTYLPIGHNGIVGAQFTEIPYCQLPPKLGPGVPTKDAHICTIVPSGTTDIYIIFHGDTYEVFGPIFKKE